MVWVECHGFLVVEILIQLGPLDRGGHTTVDLIEGTISESGICRGRGMVIRCSLKVAKDEYSCEQVVRTHSVSGVNRGDRWHAPITLGGVNLR
jgi:hypothetical protein